MYILLGALFRVQFSPGCCQRLELHILVVEQPFYVHESMPVLFFVLYFQCLLIIIMALFDNFFCQWKDPVVWWKHVCPSVSNFTLICRFIFKLKNAGRHCNLMSSKTCFWQTFWFSILPSCFCCSSSTNK